MPYFTMRDGKTLFVRIVGTGKPCLVLHGFGMHSGHWLPFLAPFLTQHRFIIPDLRGFGQSHLTSYNKPCVLTNNVEDINDILDHLRLAKVGLIGISMGAFTALQLHRLTGFDRIHHYLNIDQSPLVINSEHWQWGIFGQQSEARLNRFKDILSVIKEFSPNTPYEALPLYLRKAMWNELGKFIGAAVPQLALKKAARKICRKERFMRSVMPTDNWFAYIRCLESYLSQDYDMRPYLADIAIPVTLMMGRKSEMYPWQGQAYMHQKIPRSEIVIFEKSGHIPLLNEPLRFTVELGRFLK
ncbi:alpha/beta fold hydrolase [Alkalimarinus coralli]|uniref:alpha/beta fold hydrolase n=1 Tax=Alkalimarinus coralli TaxID=2935863 RepID=UPI00202B7650|nr:alpha/beta hydrolase [Alkalimarinus coralli]